MKFTQRPAEQVGEKVFIAAKDGSLRPVATFEPMEAQAASAVLLSHKGGDASVYRAIASLALENADKLSTIAPESVRTALEMARTGFGEGITEAAGLKLRKAAGQAFRNILTNVHKIPETVLAERAVSNSIGLIAGTLATGGTITTPDGRIMGYHAVRLRAVRSAEEQNRRAGAEFAAAVMKYVRAGAPAVHQLKVALESQDADSTRFVNPSDALDALDRAAALVADLVPTGPDADEAGEETDEAGE